MSDIVIPDGKHAGYILVHADGGDCHGMPLVPVGPRGSAQCPGCGIYPDMQSTEFWSPADVRR